MNNVLGERLRKIRENHDLSQKRAASIFGLTNHQLSRYETGKANPDPDLIAKFADYFEVTTDYILGRSDHPRLTKEQQKNKLESKVFERLQQLYKERNLTPEDIEKINEYAEFITRDKK